MKKIKNHNAFFKNTSLKYAPALLFIMFLLNGCQKDMNTSTTVQPQSSVADLATAGKDKATVATDWYNLQLKMILHANPGVPPPVAIRLFAYSGVSLFEAARFEISNSKSLHNQLSQMPVMPLPDNSKNYSWVISANAAMASITRDLFPALTTANNASIDSLEQAYNNQYIATLGADVVARSQAFGDSVATTVFNWSKTDLFNHINDPYTLPVFPGAWVPTPPAYASPLAPYFGNCRTFLGIHNHGTTIAPPYKYSVVKGSDFYAMANSVYKISGSLTDDQKNIALFWNDAGPGSYTPQGHDISIITQVLTNSNASLATAAEAYVKTGIAMWDAVITCFRSKYKFSLIRPVSYIRANIDSTWLPLLITPPLPEYLGTHEYVTTSTMEVMSALFGTNYHFTDHTYDFEGFPSRSYASFQEAYTECGRGIVYGGIEYQEPVRIGRLYGELIGKDAAAVELTK